MDYLSIILTGWAIGVVAAVPIGPVNLICIRRTLQYGSYHGFQSGLGAALGDGLFACIAGFSLTAIAQLIAGYAVPLQIIGGIMLLVMGARMFFAEPPERIDETYCNGANGNACPTGMTQARGMATTFALTTTNPGTFAWFFSGAAGLSGLSDQPSFFVTAFWVVGVILGSVTWWAALTTVVGKLHAKFDDHVVQVINRVSGVLVFVFGVAVLLHVSFPQLFAANLNMVPVG